MAGDEEGNPTPASYGSPPNNDSETVARSPSLSDGASSAAATPERRPAKATRRDRVSVGSRMTRTVITRPPYAARDELDFERRPRSNTTGTAAGSEAAASDRPGRHPGIQPALHARTADAATTRSHGSTLSGTTQTADEKGHGRDGSAANTTTEAVNDEKLQSATAASAAAPAASGGKGNDAVNAKQETDYSASRPSVPHRQTSNDASRWMAFTLPTRYRKMLDDYMARSESDPNQQHAPRPDPSSHHHFFGSHHQQQQEPAEDASDYDSEESSGDYHYRYFGRKKRRRGSQSRQNSGDDEDDDGNQQQSNTRPRLPNRGKDTRKQSSRRSSWDRHREPHRQQTQVGEGLNMSNQAMSRHNSQMAGWNSPWLPNAGADPESNVPGALHFPGLGGQTTLDAPGADQSKIKTRTQKFRRWVVRSAFAPLAFRMLNLAFTAALLGVAVSIRQIASRDGVMGIMGSSTLFAIIISPLSMFHILFNLYTEYFGSPIGVWKVRSKMFYTFTELIFICLWSGLLSLAFDDLFTSPAGCTSYTPNARYRQTDVGASATAGSLADRLCDRQAALVAMVFVGLILYVLVLIVSLFRIFAKISRIQ